MNILVLCDHGETRSVAMASLLREHGHFAVAGSYDNFKKHTCYDQMMYSGVSESGEFDLIIEMQEGGEHFIGRDEWSDCTHPEIREKCYELADKLGLLRLKE